MFFRQYYLGCLSQACYLVGDTTPGMRWWSTRSVTWPSTSPMRKRTG